MLELAKIQIAQVLRVGKVRIQQMAREGQLQRVKCDGKILYVVDPNRLKKVEHRERVMAWEAKQRGVASGSVVPAVGDAWTKASAREREIATQRKESIRLWEDHLARDSANNRRAAREATVTFIKEQKAKGIKLSKSSLYGWRCLYKTHGLEGLLPRYGGQGEMTIPQAALEIFKGCYLDQNRKTVAWCYERLKALYEGSEPLPAISAFYRYVRSLPKGAVILARQGEKAYNDLAGPFIERDYTTILPNEWWTADHHQLDAACLGLDGRPCFPWLTVIQDVRSRRWLGWYLTSVPPSQDAILAAFRRAVIRYGLPNDFLIDNGKDFKTQTFSGGVRRSRLEVDEGRARSLLAHLDVRVHFAIPRNARSKPVERAFRTLKEWFSREWETYRGGHPKERPEHMKILFRQMGDVPTLAQVDALLGEWIEHVYNTHPHQGQGMEGRSPQEVYDSLLNERRTVPKDELRLLLMRSSNPVKVTRRGLRLEAHGLTYWSEALAPHLGKEVVVRYDLTEAGRAFVFDLEDRFLCVVETKEALAWGATREDVRAALAEQRKTKRLMKNIVETRAEISSEPNPLKRVIEKRKAASSSSSPPRRLAPQVTRIHRTRLAGEAGKALAAAREAETRESRRSAFNSLAAVVGGGGAARSPEEIRREVMSSLWKSQQGGITR